MPEASPRPAPAKRDQRHTVRVAVSDMHTQMALPPGPRMPVFLQGMGWWTRPTAFMERCRARYGKRFTIRLPSMPPFVMLSDPDELKQVFTAPPDVLHPGEGARILKPVVGSYSVIL